LPVTTAVKRGLLSATAAVKPGLLTAAVAVTSLAALAAAGLPAAQAAPSQPAGLHVTGKVQIAAGLRFAAPITQAPDGAVYFGRGAAVYVVTGTATPRLVRTETGTVVGLGASSSELFVAVGKTVTEYKRSDGVKGRHWRLSSPHPVRVAGLYPVGSTVWAWTDWAGETGGEGTGAEPATISRFRTSSGAVHKITGNGAQGLLAADAAGAYFLSFSGRLEHVSPAGRVHSIRYAQYPDWLTLAGGRVEILAAHFIHNKSTLRVHIDAYQASNLRKSYSREVSLGDFALAGTGAGLLALSCPTASCSTEKAERLDPVDGKITSVTSLPYGTQIVPGRSAAVITAVRSGTSYRFFLNRLAP
jgi:hypothetical protein